MSVSLADARFLLPFPARRTAVLGSLDDWREAINRPGDLLTEASQESAELVIAPADQLDQAIALRPRAAIIVGSVARARLRGTWPYVRRVCPVPRWESRALVPLGQRHVSRYAVRHWSAPRNGWGVARNNLAGRMLGYGLAVPGLALLTIATREAAHPWLVERAGSLGVPPRPRCFLIPGQALSRTCFAVFGRDRRIPTWIVKFSRTAGSLEPFLAEERGFRMVSEAGPVVAAHAPRYLGRYQAEGHDASVETFAPGTSLLTYLVGPAPRAVKVERLTSVGRWLVEMGEATASPPDAMAQERRRLADEVLGDPVAAGAQSGLLEAVANLSGVFQHNDLGCCNVLTDRRSFTVIDWETARRCGLPLWDLLHFYQDALAHLDASGGRIGPEEHFIRLFRGELPSSALLFSMVRRAAQASHFPAEAVGPVATLCWLDQAARVAAAERRGASIVPDGDQSPYLRRLQWWLRDPSLGAGWDAWR